MAYKFIENDLLPGLFLFMTANGWAVLDDINVDDKVFGSGTVVVRVQADGTITCYQAWDDGVGYGPAVGGLVVGTRHWLWTDGQALMVVSEDGGTYSDIYAGALDPVHDRTSAATTAPVVPGEDVDIPLTSAPDTWDIGRKLLILDRKSATAEAVVVTARGPSSVTVEAVTGTYAAGALVGRDPQPVGAGQVGGTLYMVNGLAPHPGAPGHTFVSHLPWYLEATDRGPIVIYTPVYVCRDAEGEREIRGRLRGVFMAATDLVAEEVRPLFDGDYIALPAAAGGMLLMPMF